MNITIQPNSKRAKERVKQHGETMRLVREDSFRGEPAILVESLEKTFRCAGQARHWNGWFTNNEVNWEKA